MRVIISFLSLLLLALCHTIQLADGFQINRVASQQAPSIIGHRTEHDDKSAQKTLSSDKQRRTLIQHFAQAIVAAPILGYSSRVAADSTTVSSLPQVTHKVFMDIRISRRDGTFYVKRPEDIGDPTDEPVYAHLVLGLFGNDAPNCVQQFLKYVDVPFDLDNPSPSYSTTRFSTLDSESGLLIGGISGLDVTTLAGGNVLEYKGRVIPAKLWLENTKKEDTVLRHDRKGLLTHRNLDLTPSFGVTTRSSSSSLDSSHTVFGCVLEDTNGFLQKVIDIPAMTSDGIVSKTSNEPVNLGAGNAVASSLFTAQRRVFRDAAKTFGDSRLDRLPDGKLLRRIEVTQVGSL
jgi:cyclophilin family peptidyl-prolyl cis-trans isomerase